MQPFDADVDLEHVWHREGENVTLVYLLWSSQPLFMIIKDREQNKGKNIPRSKFDHSCEISQTLFLTICCTNYANFRIG